LFIHSEKYKHEELLVMKHTHIGQAMCKNVHSTIEGLTWHGGGMAVVLATSDVEAGRLLEAILSNTVRPSQTT
jgi:hypothetical protein